MNLWRRIFNERRRVLLPLVVTLIVNVAVLALVVFPLKRAVASAELSAREATATLASARREDLLAKQARTGKERADVELQKFYAEILPKSYAGATEVADYWLGVVADETGLTFRTGQWERETVRDSQLTKVTGKVTLTGEYANMRRFLYNVETAQEFVIVEKVELSQANTTQASSLLEVSLSVATYYLSPAEPGAPAK